MGAQAAGPRQTLASPAKAVLRCEPLAEEQGDFPFYGRWLPRELASRRQVARKKGLIHVVRAEAVHPALALGEPDSDTEASTPVTRLRRSVPHWVRVLRDDRTQAQQRRPA